MPFPELVVSSNRPGKCRTHPGSGMHVIIIVTDERDGHLQARPDETDPKDKDSEYVECLDCGALLEAGEVKEARRGDAAGFDESLSDA